MKRKPVIKRKPAKRAKAAPKRPKVATPKPAPTGRPSSFRPEFVDQTKELAELGARDVDLADFFGVTITTVNKWKTAHPEFLASLKVGKDQVDDRVERSLLQRALGYTFDSCKVFLPKDSTEPVIVPIREHVAPDTTACIFWLKNRRRADWRDRQELEHAGKDGGPIETREMTELEVARRLHFILDAGRRKKKNEAG